MSAHLICQHSTVFLSLTGALLIAPKGAQSLTYSVGTSWAQRVFWIQDVTLSNSRRTTYQLLLDLVLAFCESPASQCPLHVSHAGAFNLLSSFSFTVLHEPTCCWSAAAAAAALRYLNFYYSPHKVSDFTYLVKSRVKHVYMFISGYLVIFSRYFLSHSLSCVSTVELLIWHLLFCYLRISFLRI